MTSDLKIALIQENFLVGDIIGNTDKIITLANQQSQSAADLVVFPELAVTGYPPEDLLLRPGFIRQCEDAIRRIQEEVTGIDIIIGAPRHDTSVSDQLFNSALWIRNGKILASYDKAALPNYAVFDEKRYFSAGTEPCVVEIKGHRLGLLICEDIWEPEPARKAVTAGAEHLIVLNASPYHRHKNRSRHDIIKQRITETGCSVSYLNMVGGQDELVFDGYSLVYNSMSQLIARGPMFEASTLLVRLDAKGALHSESTLAPELDDLASVYNALVLGVRDYVNKNGFKGVIVGLSGGVDSALTLAIAVDAIGADRCLAVLMPSRYTAQMSNDDAVIEADLLGVEYKVIPIEKTFNAFLDTLQEPLLAGTEPDTTEENIQARCRGIILMSISNKTGYMVLTTGNKSEMAVGYATLYGDMSGGFAPLKDISKTLVYELCRYRNQLSAAIPERVLTRPPSAELAPDQVDQDTLPPYDVIDAILELSVEQDVPLDEVVAQGYDRQTVERIVMMVQRNEYKRRQAAPGVRITRRAFGRDRRYPITSGHRR